MDIRKLSRIFLLIPLLLNIMNLKPAQAAGPQLAADPTLVIWCPASVTLPKARQEGCTRTYATIADLWDYLSGHQPATAGKIWIGRTYTETLNLSFDGGALTKMAKYPIAFQGGWLGEGKGLGLKTPTVFHGVYFHIVNWRSTVSVRNIKIEAVTFALGVTRALNVQTLGSIKLDRVQAVGNDTDGAGLENGGSVTVTNSKFDYNLYSGLGIFTHGAVTLKAVRARVNGGQGVHIEYALGDFTASPVTVTNGIFEGNIGGDGLNILANGPITLTGVSATRNAGHGTIVNNTPGAGSVALKLTNTFVGNGGYGLSLASNGSVLAEHLVAHQNKGGDGVAIDNTFALTPKAVTITGSGKFYGNLYSGLNIQSDGAITTNQLTASDNLGNGISLNTTLLTTSPAVTIKGNNIVSGNAFDGLKVISVSSVILNRVIADSNARVGINVGSDNTATLTCSSASGNFTGLFVRSADGVSALPLLVLRGFFAYENTLADENIILPDTQVVRTDCL